MTGERPDAVTPASDPVPRGRPVWLRWLPLAGLLCASIAVLVSGAAQWLDFDRLMESRAWLHAAVAENRPRAIVVAALAYVCAVVVSVPASLVLTAICGFLFGTLTGAIVAVCSATSGAVIVFSIGRMAARDAILRRAGPRLGRFAEGFRRDAFSYIAFLRLLPIFPFWMTNLTPAAFGVRLQTFTLATFFGLLPGAFVYAATGAGIEDVVAAHQAAKNACLAAAGADCTAPIQLRSLLTPSMIAALGTLAAFALLSVLLKRWLERRTLAR